MKAKEARGDVERKVDSGLATRTAPRPAQLAAPPGRPHDSPHRKQPELELPNCPARHALKKSWLRKPRNRWLQLASQRNTLPAGGPSSRHGTRVWRTGPDQSLQHPRRSQQ